VVALGIATVPLFGLQAKGVETVGEIPPGLPSFTFPDFSLVAQLWLGALGIALMSFTETIAAGRAFATSEEPHLLPNQELAATGLANVGGALLGAMPSGGGTTQTAVNRLAGARTQLAELVTAASALLTMLFLAPLIGLMPEATLAASERGQGPEELRSSDLENEAKVCRLDQPDRVDNDHGVAVDLSGVPDLEYTALKMLIDAEKRQRERGVSIWLVGLNPEVLSVIQRSSLGKVLGRERMHFNLELAVAKYLAAPVSESAA
jgi:MFS superfamily sulfate permease-like transporter